MKKILVAALMLTFAGSLVAQPHHRGCRSWRSRHHHRYCAVWR
jgi:hypothetical protein